MEIPDFIQNAGPELPFLLIFLAPGAAPAAPREAAPLVSRVMREHPRIFLRAGDVPLLKERCRSIPAVERAYGSLREFAFGGAQHSNLWVAPDELISVLVACVVEDHHPKLLERARRYIEAFLAVDGDPWTRPRILKALALAYDGLHADLTGEERKKIAARMSYLWKDNGTDLDYSSRVILSQNHGGDRIDDTFAQGAVRGQSSSGTSRRNQAGGRGRRRLRGDCFSFFAYDSPTSSGRTPRRADLSLVPGLRGAPRDAARRLLAPVDIARRWGWRRPGIRLSPRARDGLAQRAAS